MSAKRIRILLIEDSEVDIELTRECLASAKVRNDLEVISDGETALKRLRNEPPYEGEPRPDLVLLDLNLPDMTGHEILDAIRGTPSVASVPVVILTSSDAERDVAQSYARGANAFVKKPVDFSRFCEIVTSIEGFWIEAVTYPGG